MVAHHLNDTFNYLCTFMDMCKKKEQFQLVTILLLVRKTGSSQKRQLFFFYNVCNPVDPIKFCLIILIKNLLSLSPTTGQSFISLHTRGM